MTLLAVALSVVTVSVVTVPVVTLMVVTPRAFANVSSKLFGIEWQRRIFLQAGIAAISYYPPTIRRRTA